MGSVNKSFLCIIFLLSASILCSAYENPIINQKGHVGVGQLISAKSLGKTRLTFNIQSDLAYDKDFLTKLIEKKDPNDSDFVPYLNELDTLYPDVTLFNIRFNAGYGITSFLDVAFFLPLYFDIVSHKTTQAGLGDLEIGLKLRVPGDAERLFQAALLASFTLPTGSRDKGYFPRNTHYFTKGNDVTPLYSGNPYNPYYTDSTVAYFTSKGMETYLAALFTLEWKRLLFHINSGIRITHNNSLDNVFVMGAALELHPTDHFAFFTELSSQMRFSTVKNGFCMVNEPFRITPGFTITSESGITVTLAGSFKLSSNKEFTYFEHVLGGRYLTTRIEPLWKASIQLGWSGVLKAQDRDNDFILDKFDACPDIPEDADGYQDSDGCPDLDNDHDAIPDTLDNCPMEPEDMDGFEDDDGCPDLDNDQDGVPDSLDRCPNLKEDKDGFNDFDGCPDYDNDNDGVPDSLDKCINIPEDLDNFEDDDGCPDYDNDLDGIPDSLDNCPDSAGVAEENGCPKSKPAPKEIKRGRVILRGIDFPGGSAVLSAQSMSVLDQVYESLVAYQEIKLEIQAHTDNSANSDYNYRISKSRADACRDYLLQKGISADRLRSVAKGERDPIADNSSVYGRRLNNRVELHRID